MNHNFLAFLVRKILMIFFPLFIPGIKPPSLTSEQPTDLMKGKDRLEIQAPYHFALDLKMVGTCPFFVPNGEFTTWRFNLSHG